MKSERVRENTKGDERVRCGNGTDTGSSALFESVFNVNLPPVSAFLDPIINLITPLFDI